MENVAVLPKLRVKRRRPPSSWLIFWGAVVGWTLIQIAHFVIWLITETYSPLLIGFNVIGLCVYLWIYRMFWWRYKLHAALEKLGIPFPPVPKFYWVMLAVIYTQSLVVWL